MSHLSSISLEHFRTFKEEETFELAPLTIITGPNSSGKSSLLKALLLLQDNAQTNELKQLDFTGGYHRLSSYQSALSHGVTDHLRFTIQVNGVLGDTLPAQMVDRERKPEEGGGTNPRRSKSEKEEKEWKWPEEVFLSLEFNQEGLVRFEVETGKGDERQLLCAFDPPEEVVTPMVGQDGEIEDYFDEFLFTAKVNGEWFYQHLGGGDEAVAAALDITSDGHFLEFLSKLKQPLHYIGIDGFPQVTLRRFLSLVSRGDSRQGGAGDDEWSASGYFRRFRQYTMYPLLGRCLKGILDTLGGIEYVGPYREVAQRIYQASGSSRDLFELLRAFAESEHGSGSVNKWMKTFGIGEGLEVEKITDVDYKVSLQLHDRLVPLTDVGRGHSQLLPLILHVGLRTKRTTLIVEEPEANLHPNLQSRLADLFLDLLGEIDEDPPLDFSENDVIKMFSLDVDVLRKRLVVETHSEYLIRRLQYLVASKQADPSRIMIYYLGPDPDAEDYIRRITITETGQLSQDFGPGFLDEATNLMVDLYKYGSQN